MSEQCLFCEICKDSNSIIYENKHACVILDKFPLSNGHLLVIPKKHAAFLHDMEDDDLQKVMLLVKKTIKICGFKKYNILQNNNHIQSIYHVHFHIIPYVEENNCLQVKWIPIKLKDDYHLETKEIFKNLFLSHNDDK